MDPELLDILVCPESKQSVSPAPAELLEKVNAAIAAGGVRNRGGDPVTAPVTEALVREDGAVLYAIREGIPVMLIDESIELTQL